MFFLIPSCAGLRSKKNMKVANSGGAYLSRNSSSDKRFKLASKLYQSGVEKFDIQEWYSAKADFNYALKHLLDCSSVESNNDMARKQSELLSQICLFQIKLNKIIYGIVPDVNKKEFSFPIAFNSRIERWLEYYVTSGRKYFGLWLRRSGKYVPWMKDVFIKEGIPEELVYVALVESGFNPVARSPKRAVGIWQFIKGTGKICGLNHNSWVDERRDPEKSTLAAVYHLKELYQHFGSWELALAAYNAGRGAIERAIRQQKTNDFWELILPAETEAYVPKIMATIMIFREPEIFGFLPEFDSLTKVDEVIIKGCVDLKIIAACCEVSLKEIVDLNPELRKRCTPANVDGYSIQLPLKKKDIFNLNFSRLSPREKYLSKEEINKRKLKGRYVVYKVKKGDCLSIIARKFRTSISNIRKWNRIARKYYIHPGDKLRIYRGRG